MAAAERCDRCGLLGLAHLPFDPPRFLYHSPNLATGNDPVYCPPETGHPHWPEPERPADG